MTLFDSNHFDLIQNRLDGSLYGRIVIISPYITTSALAKLTSAIHEDRNVIIITSWAEVNLLQGSSNLDIYPFCRSRKWELRILNHLHAKAYTIEPDIMLIGSANLSNRGLFDGENSNLELLYEVHQPTKNDWLRIESIVQQAKVIDDDLFRQYTEWFDQQERVPAPRFSPFIENNKTVVPWMPLTFSPEEVWICLNSGEVIDLQIKSEIDQLLIPLGLNKTEFFSRLHENYFSHPSIQTICEQIGGDWMRFGEIKKIVTDLFSESENERETITRYVQAFYQWVEELDKEVTFEFGIPRHSQLIRRKI
jgi:hypothetical protein